MKRFLLAVTWLSFAIVGLAAPSRATAEDDLLIADFEGDSYGDWKVEGAGNHEGKTCMNLLPENYVVW